MLKINLLEAAINNEINHCHTYLLIQSTGFEKNQEVSNEIFFVFRYIKDNGMKIGFIRKAIRELEFISTELKIANYSQF